jgi:hypothetical protein
MPKTKPKKAKKPKKLAVRRKAKPARRPARKTVKRPARRPAAKKKAPTRAKRPAAKRSTARKKSSIKIKVRMPPTLPWREPLPGESLVGKVEDFLTHLSVMLCTVQVPLAVGDTLHIRGFTTDLTEKITSIQFEHQSVPQALIGQDVGIQLVGKVRKHDFIYKVNAPAVVTPPPPAV